jgi:hypothetical protein
MPLASPLLAFAIVRLCFAQFYFENRQSVLGSRVPLRPAPTRRLRSWLLTPSTRCTTDVPTPMVRPIFTLPHALGDNAANGVPGEGRQFQLQSGQGRQRTTAAPRSRTPTPPAPTAEIRVALENAAFEHATACADGAPPWAAPSISDRLAAQIPAGRYAALWSRDGAAWDSWGSKQTGQAFSS